MKMFVKHIKDVAYEYATSEKLNHIYMATYTEYTWNLQNSNGEAEPLITLKQCYKKVSEDGTEYWDPCDNYWNRPFYVTLTTLMNDYVMADSSISKEINRLHVLVDNNQNNNTNNPDISITPIVNMMQSIQGEGEHNYDDPNSTNVDKTIEEANETDKEDIRTLHSGSVDSDSGSDKELLESPQQVD